MKDKDILELLEKKLSRDLRFRGGRVLGSMCSEPESIAHTVYVFTMDINIGDPGLSSGMLRLEQEAVKRIGSFCGLENASGRIVTGGTEANILGLWTAKRLLSPEERAQRREVVAPVTRHFSVDKAVDLMGLDLILVPADTLGRTDVSTLEKAFSARTLALVGVAGSTGLGTVDDLRAMGKLALDAHVYFHVDASFGGFVLPFLEEAGFPAPEFGFGIPGISSMSIDPHKMGRGPIPSGCILWREKSMEQSLETPVGYLSGGKTLLTTLTGTRSGASVAAVWAVLKKMGRKGWIRNTRTAMEKTFWLKSQLEGIPGIRVELEPVVNVLGFSSESLSVQKLAILLRKKGWALSEWPGFLRVVLMPHVKVMHLKAFLKDLKTITEKHYARGGGKDDPPQ